MRLRIVTERGGVEDHIVGIGCCFIRKDQSIITAIGCRLEIQLVFVEIDIDLIASLFKAAVSQPSNRLWNARNPILLQTGFR